jgi:hypothetical protein
MIDVRLRGNTARAKVSESGQLVTGDLDFSTFYLGSTTVNDTAVNVVPPKMGHTFIITAIILSSDRSVGANGAVTDVFENETSGTDGTITKQIIQEEIAKQTRMTATGLNIEVGEGRWVNVKSDDVIVRCNIAGYYVKV